MTALALLKLCDREAARLLRLVAQLVVRVANEDEIVCLMIDGEWAARKLEGRREADVAPLGGLLQRFAHAGRLAQLAFLAFRQLFLERLDCRVVLVSTICVHHLQELHVQHLVAVQRRAVREVLHNPAAKGSRLPDLGE
eukprot:3208882-Prymnesium_polylepis.1